MKRKNLMKWHIDNDLTYTDVHEKIGYSKAHYTKIIKGENDPSFEFMMKFGEAFAPLIDDVWELFKKEK